MEVKRLLMYIFALFNCLYIFTIGYFFRKNRKLISNMCELFNYQRVKEVMNPELKAIIPGIDAAGLVRDDAPVELRGLHWTDGNVSAEELILIAKLARRYKPNRLFEIGTFDGRTTLNLACNSSPDAMVYTLDLPDKNRSVKKPATLNGDMSFVNKVAIGSRFHGTDCENRITQLYGDSATFDFSPYENKMDLVFIDGAHTYEYILNDSEKALRLLRDGHGIILWHDYKWVWDDVRRALNKLYLTRSEFKDLRQIKDTSLVCLVNYRTERR